MDIKIGDKVQLKEAASLGTMQIMIVADILQREQIRVIYWCEPTTITIPKVLLKDISVKPYSGFQSCQRYILISFNRECGNQVKVK